MTRPPVFSARRGAPGMTMVEVLVVLIIFALGWMAIIPSLDLAQPHGDDRELAELNRFMEQVRGVALADGAVQRVRLQLGSEKLVWTNATFSLPSALSRLTINGDNPAGTGYFIAVYPAGACDEARLVLLSGLTLKLPSLGGGFTREEQQ